MTTGHMAEAKGEWSGGSKLGGKYQSESIIGGAGSGGQVGR